MLEIGELKDFKIKDQFDLKLVQNICKPTTKKVNYADMKQKLVDEKRKTIAKLVSSTLNQEKESENLGLSIVITENQEEDDEDQNQTTR